MIDHLFSVQLLLPRRYWNNNRDRTALIDKTLYFISFLFTTLYLPLIKYDLHKYFCNCNCVLFSFIKSVANVLHGDWLLMSVPVLKEKQDGWLTNTHWLLTRRACVVSFHLFYFIFSPATGRNTIGVIGATPWRRENPRVMELWANYGRTQPDMGRVRP